MRYYDHLVRGGGRGRCGREVGRQFLAQPRFLIGDQEPGKMVSVQPTKPGVGEILRSSGSWDGKQCYYLIEMRPNLLLLCGDST